MGYLSEKYSYVNGLVDGLGLDKDKKETKVINAMLELLDDMAITIEELEESRDETDELLDEIDNDLAELEETVYEDDSYTYDKDDDQETLTFGEVECPECGALINLDANLFDASGDQFTCPSCGEDIDVEWDYDEDDEMSCGCGCGEGHFSDDDDSDSDMSEE